MSSDQIFIRNASIVTPKTYRGSGQIGIRSTTAHTCCLYLLLKDFSCGMTMISTSGT